MSKNSVREQRRAARQSRLRTQRIVIIVVGLLVVAALASLLFFANQGKQSTGDVELGANAVTTDSGLRYEDLVTGNGTEAVFGSLVSVHYTGWLTDGTKFDSSVDRGQPFEFQLGTGSVIQGWDEGVAGMKVGGKRKLVIPPDLGYGAQGSGGVIPPNAVLIFEVELLDVK